MKEATSLRVHGYCINGAHEKMCLVKDIVTFSSCWFSPYLTLIIVILRCAFFHRDEDKICSTLWILMVSQSSWKAFFQIKDFFFMVQFISVNSVLLRVLQSLSRMLSSYTVGIYRLSSATFEQLLAFWVTLCSTSNLGQLLPSLATFEQQIDIKPI